MLMVLVDTSPVAMRVRAILGPFPAAVFADVDSPGAAPETPPEAWVLAADLARPGVLGAAVRTLRARTMDQPLIVVLGAGGWQGAAQANALGATRIVSSRQIDSLAHDPVLISRFLRTSVPSDFTPLLRQAMAEAVDVLTAMADGEARTSRDETVVRCVDTVLEAVSGDGIQAWLAVVAGIHDPTLRHVARVLGIATAFGFLVGLPPHLMRKLATGALLHDLGKAGIDRRLLDKPGELSPGELSALRAHPRIGRDMLESAGEADPDILDIVLHHHEAMDGTGFPDGLAGVRIAPLTRMATIADAFATLVEERPRKPALSPQDAYAAMLAAWPAYDRGLLTTFGSLVVAVQGGALAGDLRRSA